MTIRVGINGFGRIGRLVFRAAQKRDDIEIVGINDLIDVEYMAYMLRYDTMHGKFDGTVEVKDGKLVVNGKAIRVTAEKNPADLKWGEIGAEYVVDFLPKIKLEIAVSDELCDKVVESIASAANTGRIGDGKIFVMDLEHVMRIRTGETDDAAV